MAEKWEYFVNSFYPERSERLTYENVFNDNGYLGWELVCMFYQPDPQPNIAIFKRPKTETLTEVTEWENHHCPPDTSIGDSFMLRSYYNNSHPEDSYYFIISHETGTAIAVSFCPWCGEEL